VLGKAELGGELADRAEGVIAFGRGARHASGLSRPWRSAPA
jgi:hypothetical protein